MRKALEQEKELNELKSNFISMVSHDFRSPISGIITCVNLIKDYRNQLSETEIFDYLELILKTCHQMLQLLEDVLVIGKADAGKIKSNAIEINIQQYCQELMAEFQLSDHNKHQFHFTYKGTADKKVVMDKNSLRHILSNLLSNALKYSPSGTSIKLNLEMKEDQVFFEIQDQGIGIPPKTQQHLFELFYRGSNVGEVPGTGLGLAIVKKYVDVLDGKINFSSQVGTGTIFSVVLPAKTTELFSL